MPTSKDTQSKAAVEDASRHLAHDREPSSAAAFGGVEMDESEKPFPWDQIRKRPERESAAEKRARKEAEDYARDNANHDPLGVVKS